MAQNKNFVHLVCIAFVQACGNFNIIQWQTYTTLESVLAYSEHTQYRHSLTCRRHLLVKTIFIMHYIFALCQLPLQTATESKIVLKTNGLANPDITVVLVSHSVVHYASNNVSFGIIIIRTVTYQTASRNIQNLLMLFVVCSCAICVLTPVCSVYALHTRYSFFCIEWQMRSASNAAAVGVVYPNTVLTFFVAGPSSLHMHYRTHTHKEISYS